MDFEDPFDRLAGESGIKKLKFHTPGGKVGKPFQILSFDEDGLKLRTSTGGRVSLRREVFQVAEQLLRDLGSVEEGGWVPMKDETLSMVLRGQNRDKACSSYVFPLLAHLNRVEIKRGRAAQLRLSSFASEDNTHAESKDESKSA